MIEIDPNLFDDIVLPGDEPQVVPFQPTAASELEPRNIFADQGVTEMAWWTIWDIETGPRPEAELRTMFTPPDPSSVKGAELIEQKWNPDSVKLGNTKDAEKVALKIQTERRRFEMAQEKAKADVAGSEAAAWQKLVDRAALDATTGRVVAIGYRAGKLAVIDGQPGLNTANDVTERWVLRDFWAHYLYCKEAKTRLIGFNTSGFDVPFLVRRSWLLEVEVPLTVFRGRYIDPDFVDLMDLWRCGDYRRYDKLDVLAAYFGCARKNGEGADFARLWFGNKEEHAEAVAYLENDLKMTEEVAHKMGVI